MRVNHSRAPARPSGTAHTASRHASRPTSGSAARPGVRPAVRPAARPGRAARHAPAAEHGPHRHRWPWVLRRLGRADRWAFDRVAAARLRGLEYVLPRLSRSADHGVLWFTTAGVLGAGGRPRLRRAALRGSIAIAVASPAVNIIGKHAFRRKRPVVDLVPPRRIRWKLPTSHAFPSGHSASAAAFATGVALEAPTAVAAPIAATAAAVAFARVYTGAHYPGDVLAGVGIGVLAAIGTRVVWPARPPTARIGPGGAEDVHVAADGRGVVAVANMGSGDDSTGIMPTPTDMTIGLLARELPAAEIVRLYPDDDADKVLGEAAERAEVLAVVGGDGTVNAGARAALEHDVPLLVVPGGTFDHFARAYGIETPADAIAAFRAGRLGRVDVGSVQGPDQEQLFLNTASFGAYTEIVDRRDRLERRLGKWPALAVAAVRTLRRSEPVEVDVDGHRRRVWLAFVGNCAYGSPGAAPTWRDRLDDGRLDIRMIATGRRVPRVRAVVAVLAGHLPLTPGYRAWRAGGLELWSPHGGLRLARDGEVSTVSGTVRFGKRPRALAVFCPA